MKRLLILGWRNGLLPAVTALGYNLWVITPQPLPRRIQPHLQGYCYIGWDSPTEALVQAAHTLCQGNKPDAIIAVTEAAVVPAASLRAALGITGLTLEAAHRAHDKYRMKQCFAATQIPHTDFVLIDSNSTAAALSQRLGLPVAIKPRRSSGSRNLTIAHSLPTLAQALTPDYLAERYIEGIEMSVESFVVGGQIQFCNLTQYFIPRHANILPYPHPQTETIHALNQQVVTALGIERGMTHLELFLTPSGWVVGEIAARPPGGYIMDLLALAYAFDPWQALIHIELGEAFAFPKQATRYAGVWLWHPGAGILKTLQGIEQIRALPDIVDMKFKIKPEDVITTRLGVGQDVGRALIAASTYEAVVKALQQAQQLLQMELYS